MDHAKAATGITVEHVQTVVISQSFGGLGKKQCCEQRKCIEMHKMYNVYRKELNMCFSLLYPI